MQHLTNGITRMLPFIVAGALFMAFAGRLPDDTPLARLLTDLGSQGGLALMLPVLAGFIAHSIAGWDGLLPGMIGGLLATRGGSGMFGAIAAGYLAGYLTAGLQRWIRLPAAVKDLKPVLVLPALSTLAVGAVIAWVVNPPVSLAMQWVEVWLTGLQGESAAVLGLILGGMAAFDMGGPVNKVASLFALDLLASGVAEPMGAIIAGVLGGALGICLAIRLSPRRYTPEERRQGQTALVLGLLNIAEGTIPLLLADPRRVVPAVTAGGAVAGAVAMALGAGVRLPVGGLLTPLIPGMTINTWGYLIAIAAGILVTALGVNGLKPARSGQGDSGRVVPEPTRPETQP